MYFDREYEPEGGSALFPRKLSGQLRKQLIVVFVSRDAGSGGRQVFLECEQR